MNAKLSSSAVAPDRDNEALPPIGEVALVQCEHFRCLAYRDKKGVWKYHSNSEPISGNVFVIERFG